MWVKCIYNRNIFSGDLNTMSWGCKQWNGVTVPIHSTELTLLLILVRLQSWPFIWILFFYINLKNLDRMWIRKLIKFKIGSLQLAFKCVLGDNGSGLHWCLKILYASFCFMFRAKCENKKITNSRRTQVSHMELNIFNIHVSMLILN